MFSDFQKGETTEAMAGFLRSMDPFGRLCQVGNLKGVEDAIKIGADVNTRDLFGWTGLMMALHHNHPAVATMLVQNPAVDVNIASDNGDCALHIAAMDDEMGDCLALILAREDLTTVNSQDEDGSTPLMVAISRYQCSPLSQAAPFWVTPCVCTHTLFWVTPCHHHVWCTAQCGVCDSEGEIDADKTDDIVIDSDGFHRLQ